MHREDEATCFFVSDIHGSARRWERLLERVAAERPTAVLVGGDVLPSMAGMADGTGDFRASDFDDLASRLERLRQGMGENYPRVLVIPGNDDPMSAESSFLEIQSRGLWEYIPSRRVDLEGFTVVGYPYSPPSPFLLKDWERYDVSRGVDPGCVPPEEGWRTVEIEESIVRFATIRSDLERLAIGVDMGTAVFLFHAPPYRTCLDRSALDGRSVDGVPLEVHVGSIAIREMIEAHQPLVTLHGHVHESVRLTGRWMERIGRTVCLGAAHDGRELAVVHFSLRNPSDASRELF